MEFPEGTKVIGICYDYNSNHLISAEANGIIIKRNVEGNYDVVDSYNMDQEIVKFDYINSLAYFVVTNNQVIKILNGETYSIIYQVTDRGLVFDVNERNNALFYSEVTLSTTNMPDTSDKREEIEFYIELYRLKLEAMVSEKIHSWKCKRLIIEEEFCSYEKDELCELIDIKANREGNIIAILLHEYFHEYEPDYDETKAKHNYYLIFFYENSEQNRILIKEEMDISEMAAGRALDNILQLRNNKDVIEFSHDGDLISLSGIINGIGIWGANPRTGFFSKCLHKIAQSPAQR